MARRHGVPATSEHAVDHARGNPQRRLRGGGRDTPECPANEPDRDPRDDPLTGGDRLEHRPDAPPAPLPPRHRDACAGRPDPVRRDRGPARRPESRGARGHPLDARRGPLRGRLRDVRCRASRPADDPPDGGPRDHRDGARVGVRPAVPRSGEAGAAARGGGRRRGPRLPRRGDQGDSSHPARRPVRWARAARGGRARRLRAPCRNDRDAGDLPCPHAVRRLSERPYEFRPERFLDETPETYGWIPFGGGTRRCIGAAFAELEMRVVLSTILRRATLRPASDRPEKMVRRNVTLSPRGGTPAVLVERR